MNNSLHPATCLYSNSEIGGMIKVTPDHIEVIDQKSGRIFAVSKMCERYGEDIRFLAMERIRVEKSSSEFVEMLAVKGKISVGVITEVHSQCLETKKQCEILLESTHTESMSILFTIYPPC